jgi:thiol-disulfide isomerase/thioredoxin
MIEWQAKFEQGLPYQPFLAKHADPRGDLPRWQQVHAQVRLSESQMTLLGGFVRRMNVLCLLGAWCGDCIEQGPILQRIAEAAAGRIDLRFLDRDAHPDVQEELRICGGNRVPVVVFLSEDLKECARFGDRTLSMYRQMAEGLAGTACRIGRVHDSEDHAAQVQDWLDEFERVQLMLRLSPRLRRRHMD